MYRLNSLELFTLIVFINLFIISNCSLSDLSPPSGLLKSPLLDEYQPLLEEINGTGNYRMHGKRGKEDKAWFEGREMKYIYCIRPAKCEKLRYTQCLGTTIPYTSTSLDLTDSYSQEQTLEKLNSYQALKHVPKCWAVIQPFLCAVFIPKCEVINKREMVFLPSLEMCRITLEPCRILYNTSYFPSFLKCNDTLFPSKCNNDVREMKFNATGQCLKPLVAADSSANYYKDIDGCGVQCNDPLYTEDEHRQIQKLIAWGASICLIFNLFTIATFLIDWKSANKYPALVIFYINFCFMMSCFGWLAQFTPGGREDIVCRKDGTLRHSEPSAGENLSCIIVFVLVYYFLIAAMVWFVIFTYAWHMSFKAIGKIQDRIDKKASYFHLAAWSLPLVLTITIMALSEIDGSGVVGICFVGYLNHPIRASFLLGPVIGVLLIGGYFLSRGMLTLIKLKISSKEFISARASNKIRETIVRMGLCTLFTLIFILTTIVCHIHEFKNASDWAQSLKEYILCKISSTYSDSHIICKMKTRPSVAILQLHLLCLFASGIVMSSWVWTHSTMEAWGRYLRRKLGAEIEEPVKLQKHKLIAQAFAKRKEFQNQGRLSISFHNSHTDPVGLKFDLNSIASHDFSSTWANNLPRFVNRRYALTGAATSSSHGPRRNSVDSEISFSVRHVSVESRRNSIDSQVSVKIAEMKTKVASRTSRTSGKSSHGNSKRHRRRDFSSHGRRFSRRESSTSMESQIITALQKARYSDKRGSFYVPTNKNMKRRSGNAGLDSEQMNNLLTKGKLILPFLQNQGMTTSDDEENASITSFKVKDSRLNVILKQALYNESEDDDEYDEERVSFLKKHNHDNNHRINIEEYHTSDDDNNKVKMNNNKKKGYPNIKDIIDNNLNDENLSYRSSKDGNGRNSKNSTKSLRSKKSSSRQGTLRRSRKKSINRDRMRQQEMTKNKDKEKELVVDRLTEELDDSSFTSFCSELSPLGVNNNGNIQSSYSGISITKTHSRSSKRSCDVGIQTNAHEIATQTLSSYEDGLKLIDIDKIKRNNEYDKNINTENNEKCNNKRKDTMTRIGNSVQYMSETEKLKLLLLPSK